MCLSFICDIWLLKIILNSTELKCTQNIKLYLLSIPLCPYHFVQCHFVRIPFCLYHFVRTILSATILSGHQAGLISWKPQLSRHILKCLGCLKNLKNLKVRFLGFFIFKSEFCFFVATL